MATIHFDQKTRLRPARYIARLLVTLFAIALCGGAAVAFADSTPVGALPAGPAASIDVQHGELVALALPQCSAGRVWRMARPFDAAVLRQVSEASVGAFRRGRVPRQECRTHDRLDRADEGRQLCEGARVPTIPHPRSLRTRWP